MVSVHSLSFDVVEVAAERLSALFVEDPGVALVDFIAVHPGQVLDAGEFGKLGFGDAPQRKEIGAEPDLLDMGLMGVLSDNLLDCKLFPTFYVFAQPHQTEPSPPQQLNLLKPIGESFPECLLLLFGEPIPFFLVRAQRNLRILRFGRMLLFFILFLIFLLYCLHGFLLDSLFVQLAARVFGADADLVFLEAEAELAVLRTGVMMAGVWGSLGLGGLFPDFIVQVFEAVRLIVQSIRRDVLIFFIVNVLE